MRRSGNFFGFLLACFVLLSHYAKCQNSQSYLNDTGNPAYGITIPVENGFINTSNGNLHMEFPLATHPQRGALKLNERLVYDSRIWMFSSFGTHGSYHWWPYNACGGQALCSAAGLTSGGWSFVTGLEGGPVSYNITGNNVQNVNCLNYGGDDEFQPAGTYTLQIAWTDPNDATHLFNSAAVETFNDCTGDDSTSIVGGLASDGSGYTVSDDGYGGPLVVDNNGTQVLPQIIDRYGNYWSNDANGNLVDDKGLAPVIVTQNGNITYYDVLAANGPINNQGTRVRYTVTTAQVYVATAFNQSDTYEFTTPGVLTPVQSILLPDGSQYTFSYDSYGELSQVTLPTGGIIQYGYSNFLDSSNTQNRWLTSRTVGSNPAMTFTPSVVTTCLNYSTGCVENVNLHKPSGDETVYALTLNNGAWNTATTTYTGSATSGQVLAQVTNVNTYTNSCSNASLCIGANYLSKSLMTTTLSPNTNAISTQTQTNYDPSSGKLSSVKVWDYYPSSSSPSSLPTRETDYVYTGHDIQSVALLDNNGVQVAQTSYGYAATASSTSGIVQHGAQNAGGPYLHTVTNWLNTGASPQTTYAMDDTGMVTSITDPNQNQPTIFTYQCSHAIPNQVTNPIGQVTTYTYDCGSGAMINMQDPNDLAANRLGAQYAYEPVAGRLQSVTLADGGQTSYTYPSSTEVDTSILATPDPTITSQDIVDSFGRKYQQIQSGIYSETTYDLNGRVSCISNPYLPSTSSTTDGSTCVTAYDGLDRPLVQMQSDGVSILNWLYSANVTTSYDELGNGWKRTTNVFGQLKQVLEPGSPDGPGTTCGAQGCRSNPSVTYETDYTYDALGNINLISQMGGAGDTPRPRTFLYDSLSRLILASSPEAGYTCYGTTPGNAPANATNCTPNYDLNGNLKSKTDSRGQRLDYQYDALNRMYSKTSVDGSIYNHYYYDTPASLYGGTSYSCSNGLGRLCLADHTGNSGTAFNYDPSGRTASTITSAWTSNSGIFTPMMAVTYNAAGNPHTITYPDGRQITQSYDSVGRLLSVGPSGGTAYYTANSFTPAGQPLDVSLGNGFSQDFTFNSRLQMCADAATMASGTANALQLFSKQLFFSPSATSACANVANNSGNINKIVDYYNGGTTAHTQTMQYDSLSRLTSAIQQDGIYNRSYTPDAFGNMIPFNNGIGTHPNLSINTANQLQLNVSQYSYDADGTLLSTGSPSSNGGHAYSYNAEDMMTSVDSGSTANYGYNALGERVYKLGSISQYVYLNGQPMAEQSGNGTWTDYIYAGTGRVAKIDSADTRFHLTGVNGSSTDTNRWTVGLLPLPSSNITIQAGDVLNYRIYQHNASAGISMGFTDGSNSDWYNNGWKYGSIQPDTWVNLSFSLDGPMVTKTMNQFQIGNYQVSPDGEFDVMIADVAITHADGSVTPIPALIGTYSWGGDTTDVSSVNFVGEQVATTSGQIGAAPLTRYFLSDHLGTTQYELAGGGWPLYQAVYTPFGEEIVPQTTMNHYKFASLERDAESSDANGNGLDHAQYRQYSSPLGRWMSPDPYLGSMDIYHPQTFNRYAYVNNNPLNYNDPSGLFPIGCGFGGAVNDGVVTIGFGVGIGEIAAVAGAVGCAIAGIDEIFNLFHHPKFTGSTAPRPNAQIWDEHGSFHASPYSSIASMIGDADGITTPGCEFGACGNSFGPGGGAQPCGASNPDVCSHFGDNSMFLNALKLGAQTYYSVFRVVNPEVQILECQTVNFVTSHPLSVGVPVSVAAIGLGKVAPEAGIALGVYTDIYVPIAANTFCKGKTQ